MIKIHDVMTPFRFSVIPSIARGVFFQSHSLEKEKHSTISQWPVLILNYQC